MQQLKWSTLDLNKLIQNPADQEYHIKVQVMAFEISKGIDIFNMNELQRFQAENNAFNQLEGDIMEGMITRDQIPFQKPTIYGFYIWARAYDTLHFINLRAQFKTRLTVEHKQSQYPYPSGFSQKVGLDFWDPQTGIYKFIQTRQFFIEQADDSAYELEMKRYVFGQTSIEPSRPRFANETKEYQTYIDSRSVSNANNHTVKWPSPLNRFAYYKSLDQEDKSKFQRLKQEFILGRPIDKKLFPDINDDPAYDDWVLVIILAGYDEDAQKRSILSAEHKSRFDLEYVEWRRYLTDKIAPSLTNRYAFYKHLQSTDPTAFDALKKTNQEKHTEQRVIAQICPLETAISGTVFQGAQYLMGVKPTLQNTIVYAAAHTVKQMILQDGIPNNALQADDQSLFLSAQTTGMNILQGAGLQWALFTGIEFYLNGKQDIGHMLKTFISSMTGQSILELRQLILDIKARAPAMKEKNPKAPTEIEMVIAGVLFQNPLAPLPDWMKSALDDTGDIASDSIGALKWVAQNLELIGIIVGSVLLLALIGFIYAQFKSTAPQIILQKN